MFDQISAFFTIEMIFLWLSFGVLPFWFILIFFPQSKICGLLATSIFPLLILGSVYIYLLYYYFNTGYDFLGNFELYFGIYNLANLFENETFLPLITTYFIGPVGIVLYWFIRIFFAKKISLFD